MESIAVQGSLRTEVGKKASKAVRKEGLIPCVLYGGEDVIHFTTTLSDVKGLIYTADFKIAEISVDGKTHRCILKSWQAHPLTDAIEHIDFLRLIDGNKINVEVPVKFKGSSAGEKVGGKLQQSVRRVKIKTTPEKLIDAIFMDISHLKLGQSIRIRDIEPIEGVEIVNSPGIPVATIEIPRALRSAEAKAEAEAAQ